MARTPFAVKDVEANGTKLEKMQKRTAAMLRGDVDPVVAVCLKMYIRDPNPRERAKVVARMARMQRELPSQPLGSPVANRDDVASQLHPRQTLLQLRDLAP